MKELLEKYLRNNRLINSDRVLEDLEVELRMQGYAGPTDISKIVYLAGISRVLAQPVSVVVMGPSGAGKTYAIESGLQFITPTAIENLAGMSEKALPYLPEDISLKNRILYLGEASGMADGDGRTFLRQLLSENKISYLTVQKTKDGNAGKKLPEVQGPVAFMMATTANRIHHEDQSRMLALNVAEDHQRVRQALINQAKGLTKSSIALDLTPWHQLCDFIADNKMNVTIPYGVKIAEGIADDVHFKIQRDFQKILSLISACALVHFNRRDRAEDGSVIANEEDYRSIYSLLDKPLSEGMGTLVKPGIKDVVEAVRGMEATGVTGIGISLSKLAERMRIDRTVVGRNVHAAVNEGYLINESPGQGREAKVASGDRKLEHAHVLPKPEDVFQAPVKPPLPW